MEGSRRGLIEILSLHLFVGGIEGDHENSLRIFGIAAESRSDDVSNRSLEL
jgi:hypothetical protein